MLDLDLVQLVGLDTRFSYLGIECWVDFMHDVTFTKYPFSVGT